MVCVGIKKILFIIIFHFFLYSCIAPDKTKSVSSTSEMKLNASEYDLIKKEFNLLPRENQQKILNHYIEKNNIIVYPLKRKRNLI